MKAQSTRIAIRYILRHRMLIFLLSIFLLLIMFPLIQIFGASFLFIDELFFNLSLIGGVYLVSKNKKIFVSSTLLAVMSVTIIWFDRLLESKMILVTGLALETLFFAIVAVVIIKHVLQYKKVTEDKFYGAISAYLMLGIIGSMLYTILELLNPNSFHFASGIIINEINITPYRFYFSQFLYFSFITLSSLGYGDIVPVSGLARLFSSMEAVTGQLYVAVLIARLVGLHISHTQMKLYEKNKR